MRKISLGIVGATGLVGSVALKILQEQDFPLQNLRLFASERSAGTKVEFANRHFPRTITVENLSEQNIATLKDLNVAIFSAGSEISKTWAPIFAQAGVVVIDNSNAWRSDPQVPLIVSEVNPGDLSLAFSKKHGAIIANPNCSTMAAMPVLNPLHRRFGLQRLIVSTYQAVSGAGLAGVNELRDQAQNFLNSPIDNLVNGTTLPLSDHQKFAAPIAFNALPYAGSFVEDGSNETDEEQKLRFEARKILHLPDLRVSATCVRVPVFTGHSLSITAEFKRDISPELAVKALENAPGVELQKRLPSRYLTRSQDSKFATNPITAFPTPLLVAGKNPVWVGRFRQDQSALGNNSLNFFVVSDNLRKGAALNTIELAKLVMERLV